MIHATAIIDPGAELGSDVAVGPYTVIGAGVEIGDETSIDSHVVLKGPTRIGKRNRIFSFCSLGDDPQDKKYGGEADSRLQIGDDNTIREFCSINRGTRQGGGLTRLGNDNWIMAYVHVAHDCLIGDHTVFANNATLAGHVQIDDFAILGGFTGVHQFCRIGSYSLTAISAVVVKDVPPFIIVTGNTAVPAGLNKIGLQRHDFSSSDIAALKKAYKTVFRRGLLLQDALQELDTLARSHAPVAAFVEFIRNSSRGVSR